MFDNIIKLRQGKENIMKRNNTGTGSRNSVKKNSGVQQQRKPNQTESTRLANIKQFKMEIDLQIEKCLDNLDRNGLKYLKQTLKNSNIFNQQISEIINMENNKQNTNSPAKPKNSEQIQEEIIQEFQYLHDKQEQPSKEKTFLGSNTNKPLKQQKPIPVKLQKFQNKIQQPLKPFAKRIQSRQGSHGKSQEQKAILLEKIDSKILKQQPQIKDKSSIDMIVQKINQLPEQKLKKLGKIIERLQRSQKLQEQQFEGLKTRPYMLKPDQAASNQSSMKSTSNKQKKNEKATSLYNSIIKGNKKASPQAEKDDQQKSPTYEKHQQQVIDQNEISEQISQIQIQNQISEPKKMDIPDKMFRQQNSPQHILNASTSEKQQRQDEKFSQSNMSKKSGSQIIKKGSFLKNFPISNIKKPLDIEVTESHQADTLELNQGNSSRMVRLGKKKLGTNKVKLVLLRNRGHPTIIGLTCVQFYNVNGKLIPISLENIKSQSSAKLLKLFNGVSKTINEEEMFTTIIKRDYEIELQIPQKIGGIKIWNYNKSQIESPKETDWIQVYINDRLSWEGLIKKGSYNEITDYCTFAEIEQGFKFQNCKNQLYKINEVSQNQHALYVGRTKDASKVDWLQKTLMEQKIKKIEEEEVKNKQTIQFRKTGNKINRFSQIFQQQESSNKLNTIRKQESDQKKLELNVRQKQGQPIIQRVNRTNSKRIQDEKDIFSNFGQNFIKQKIKSHQINAKVNQISEKVQKLKQTYKKQQFGYSSLINKQEIPDKKIQKIEPKVSIQLVKQKKSYQRQSLDDFMNDSIFQDPVPKIEKKIIQRSPSRMAQKQPSQSYNMKKLQQKSKVEVNQNNKVDIDDFLNELDDLVGSKEDRYQFGNEKQKFITIPQLPKGSKVQIVFLSNWGDVQYIGINKIQFFDSQGQKVFPTEARSNIQSNSLNSVFSQNKGYLNQQSEQWKCVKKQEIKIFGAFSKKVQLSLIRFWNYVGDRVHSMIGVRKIQILLDGCIIFMGDLRKTAGNSRDQIFKSCEPVLFTNNVIIQKRIIQNDWLAQQLQIQKQETIIFKKTLQNFMRPLTNGLSQMQIKLNENKQGIKLPKRNCFEYDPPTLPSGYYIKLVLHKTWGDRDFIGLNGIVIFDQKGCQVTDVKKISQFPAPLVALSGYEKDKRVLNNLFNGKNLTTNDQSIWLAPYLRDVDKMQKQAQNAILIQFDKICTFSSINLYNYAKNAKRGVRQIQIFVDNFLVYRGYLRMANLETGQILTTINFTKDPTILQKVGYMGYNEDNLGQEVNFYNEGKPQKAMF